MIDVKKETERLTRQFIAQLEALGAQMSAETKAVSWTMAAEVIAAGLQAVAVGCLSWDGKDAPVKRAKLALPVKQKPDRNRLDPSSYNASGVHIKGPKPKERAERYRALLDGRSHQWSRRDSLVRYTVVDTKVTHSVSKAFYKMRRLDNGVEKWVKFTSIVSDWKCLDA